LAKGSGVSLHGSNREPLMSAFGHKQTSAHVRIMSALPPKVEMDQHGRDVRFGLIADIAIDNFTLPHTGAEGAP
jgi:hypothetical protein